MSGTKLVIAGAVGGYAIYVARRFGQLRAAGLFTPGSSAIAPPVPETLPAQIMYTVRNSFPFGALKIPPREPVEPARHLAPDLLGPLNWEQSPVGNRLDR